MSKRLLTDEQINALVESLQGTCNSLDLYLEDELGLDMLEQGDYDAIDGEIFQCTECSWWCPQDENVAEDGEEWICRDCHNKE